MRAHLAAAPAAHRAPITMFVPRGHPAHRASTAHMRAAQGSSVQWLPARDGLPAALAATVGTLTLLTAVLLGAAPGGRAVPASPMPPWHAAVPASPVSGAAARAAVPGIWAPASPALAIPAVVLHSPHFIRVPTRQR